MHLISLTQYVRIPMSSSLSNFTDTQWNFVYETDGHGNDSCDERWY